MCDLTEHPQVAEAQRDYNAALALANRFPDDTERWTTLDAKWDALISAIVSAYRSALAGETQIPVLAQRLYEALGYGDKVHSKPALCDALETVLAPLLVQLQDKNERIETLEQERDVFRHTLNALHGAITNGVFLAATGEDAPLAQREFDNLCVVLGYRRTP